MKRTIQLNSDKIIIILAELYIIFPIIVFFMGWLNIVWALLGALAIY